MPWIKLDAAAKVFLARGITFFPELSIAKVGVYLGVLRRELDPFVNIRDGFVPFMLETYTSPSATRAVQISGSMHKLSWNASSAFPKCLKHAYIAALKLRIRELGVKFKGVPDDVLCLITPRDHSLCSHEVYKASDEPARSVRPIQCIH